ncbi:hypothetical protein I3760_01G029900 [Carya illinoinensis]|uniref:Uncharacterized protein n=1 Tax=Carya illinoinensis TaxID=32201 RepID=A0A922K829_CARIL|nr:hypothetical protein I3760_01G029900 [Carya illinoinensis]KAG6729517.1 hypothetical protein I3842_01G031900 [Carya illinoinensis]
MGNLGNGVAEAFERIGHAVIGESSASLQKSSGARSSFQWGGTFFALGQFGCWVAFLAVAANLFDPQNFPAARFLLFVITPDGLADGLRDDLFSCIFCLIIGVSIVIIEKFVQPRLDAESLVLATFLRFVTRLLRLESAVRH